MTTASGAGAGGGVRPIVRLTRRLAPAEAERRDRILAAASDLAAEHGYAATTIRLVARRAEVAPNTVYRYFASKDHLLHEVMLSWAGRTTQALAAQTFTGGPDQRVAQAFTAVARWAAGNMPMLGAGVATLTSPEAAYGMDRWHEMFTAYARQALGDDAPADVAERAPVVGHVLVSCLVNLASGRTGLDQACRLLETASRLAFAPAREPREPDPARTRR